MPTPEGDGCIVGSGASVVASGMNQGHRGEMRPGAVAGATGGDGEPLRGLRREVA